MLRNYWKRHLFCSTCDNCIRYDLWVGCGRICYYCGAPYILVSKIARKTMFWEFWKSEYEFLD